MALLEMPATCKTAGGNSWSCAAVYHWTGNEDLAHAAAWLIGKPLTIAWIVFLALVARWLMNRAIGRMVHRAQIGVLPTQLARGPFAEPENDTARQRRVQRALTIGTLLRSIVSGVIVSIVVMMVLSEVGVDIAVGYKEDVTRVRRLLKEVAHDLWEDEAFHDLIIEEPEVWGVQSLGPDSVVVRVTLKTMPQQQWNVSREMRERVKMRFDEEGIQMPQPYWREPQPPR
jgi:small-conductance mechanosensitive channel